jgi:hypothetical protein
MLARLLVGVILMGALASGVAAGAASGPLRVSARNPRYFEDVKGHVVFLTGAHTWGNLRDLDRVAPPKPFDWPAYLDFLTQHHHNFIRLWAWDSARCVVEASPLYCQPLPWPRSGPESALDGQLKFDLSRFDQSYFDRLRTRVQEAGRRGIYVSIMLFEGWGVQFAKEAWAGHPFNVANNVNGLDGDPAHAGEGLAVCTLEVPAVMQVQEAYVRKVIDTVNDLDNVLYEIANEAGPPSTEWQYHMIRFVKEVEAKHPKQHPVGMTFAYKGGTNQALFDSRADWISPNPEAPRGYDYQDNPPPAAGEKVIFADTDHLWGIGGTQAWVWKTVCRGIYPLFMDPYDVSVVPPQRSAGIDPAWEPVRLNLGYARRFAERMDLSRALPSEAIASSKYCLAVPGSAYLIYLPEGGSVKVDLGGIVGKFRAEWFDPTAGKTHPGEAVAAGGAVTLQAPFSGDAVLFLHR